MRGSPVIALPSWGAVIKKVALFFVYALLAAAWFSPAKAAHAATLYFSPSSGTYNVGQNFSVAIYVSSSDQPMNAADGVVDFPSDRLQVTSLSKAGSIMSLWVQEPGFNNGSGKINFEGIVLNPGFTGAAGKIITINFKVKSAGSGTLSFTSGSVLANDGQGTNILSGLASANFTLISSVSPETPPPAPKETGSPGAPEVTSPTHPVQSKWYANNNPKFDWPLPKNVDGVSVLADRDATASPGPKSDGHISTYSYTGVDDGVWYFHIRFHNSQGWGKVTHYRFQIDTAKPDYVHVTELKGPEVGVAQFKIEAHDALSGVDVIRVQIDNREPEVWNDDGTHVYRTPTLDPGKHTLLVKAIDKAGNFLDNSTDFTITAAAVVCPAPARETSQTANILIILIPSLFFLLVLLLLLVHIWNKLRDVKKRVRKELRQVESGVHDAFKLLQSALRKHIKMLEGAATKRELTREEEKILDQMADDIEAAERLIGKEIDDIREEVE